MPGDKFKYENSLEDEMVHVHGHVRGGYQLQLGLEPGERTSGWGIPDEEEHTIAFLQSQGYHIEHAPTPIYKAPYSVLDDPHLAAFWEQEDFSGETGENEYIWTNKKHPKLTVEMHTFSTEVEEGEDETVEWYVYPAYDGRGLPNSPYLTSDEDDALREASKLLHTYSSGEI